MWKNTKCIVAFTLQQWLRKRVTVLQYTTLPIFWNYVSEFSSEERFWSKETVVQDSWWDWLQNIHVQYNKSNGCTSRKETYSDRNWTILLWVSSYCEKRTLMRNTLICSLCVCDLAELLYTQLSLTSNIHSLNHVVHWATCYIYKISLMSPTVAAEYSTHAQEYSNGTTTLSHSVPYLEDWRLKRKKLRAHFLF